MQRIRSQRPTDLFREMDVFSFIERRLQGTAEMVGRLDKNQVLNVSIEDICSDVEQRFSLETPELHEDQAVVDQEEGDVVVHDAYSRALDEGPAVVQGTVVELEVPFSGDSLLFNVRPSRSSSDCPSAVLLDSSLVFTVSGCGMTSTQVRAELDSQLTIVREYLGWLREMIDPFNAQLRQVAREHVEHRRQKLLADQNLVAALDFPLKRRDDAPKTYAVPVARRRLEVRRTPESTKSYVAEPTLDEVEYQHILRIMTNMSYVLERNPSAFETMKEEHLRDHFLVQLNGQYEGQATGETFNHHGKTDILIRWEGRNVFIAECKFWEGAKRLVEAIDQILSYLSWRDTKAAIVIFSRNQDLSGVLAKVQGSMPEHPLYKVGPKVEGESRFRYVFGQESDPNREVMLTVLVFEVPTCMGKAKG